jgi:hypothetical protein
MIESMDIWIDQKHRDTYTSLWLSPSSCGLLRAAIVIYGSEICNQPEAMVEPQEFECPYTSLNERYAGYSQIYLQQHGLVDGS